MVVADHHDATATAFRDVPRHHHDRRHRCGPYAARTAALVRVRPRRQRSGRVLAGLAGGETLLVIDGLDHVARFTPAPDVAGAAQAYGSRRGRGPGAARRVHPATPAIRRARSPWSSISSRDIR